MVNQVEINPFIQRKELINFCKENNVVIEAYSPLGGIACVNDILKNDKLKELSKIKNKTISQII